MSVAKRVALAAPRATWETERYREALAWLRALHPNARIFDPASYLTPELEWGMEEEELPRVNHHGEIAWDSILCHADVLYVLEDESGDIGSGTRGNITRARNHGALICLIVDWTDITELPEIVSEAELFAKVN